MNSDVSNNNAELSEEALSALNIGSGNDDDEKEAITITAADDNNISSTTKCSNCGKEGYGDSMNTCNKCLSVKYCNAACKKKHRHKHKKACEKRAAELYDEKLFKEPPPPEECPICMLPLPIHENHTGATFYSCCGKVICIGCIYTMKESGAKNLCPFCRIPYPRLAEEVIERIKKLMRKGNADAFYVLAGYYAFGKMDLRQNRAKANEFYLKAGELGCANGFYNLGQSYYYGRGFEMDKKKATHYYELAAMNGMVIARYNLGADELEAGNYERAFKHYTLAARAGDKVSLDQVKEGYAFRRVTKDQYASTLKEYQKSHDEMKSDARDKALANRNDIH